MRALSEWLEAYGESHQNPINQKIHKVAVPGIFLSVVGLIWSIPQIPLFGFNLNWVWLAALPAWIFYFRLSLSVFMMMIGYTVACIGLIWSMEILGCTGTPHLNAAIWNPLDIPVYRAQDRGEEALVFRRYSVSFDRTNLGLS